MSSGAPTEGGSRGVCRSAGGVAREEGGTAVPGVWAFATRGDAAIIAKKYGGHVAADVMFSHEEIAQQLDETRTGATLPTGPLGNWLLKQRLVRHNRKTGWFDLTPLGRERLEDLRREVQ